MNSTGDGGSGIVIALEKLLAKGEWVTKARGIAAIVAGLAMTGVANRRDLRCKQLTFSLKNEDDPKAEKAFSLSGSPSGVELTAKLTDPLGNLETIIRYQRAIRRDRDNAADRLLKLQRARAKLKREHRHYNCD